MFPERRLSHATKAIRTIKLADQDIFRKVTAEHRLKERRRDLIVALMGRHGPLSERQIAEIASIQRTEGHIGAVAFSRTGDPGSGEFVDAVLLKAVGEVPSDLSVLERLDVSMWTATRAT
jgi:hypothetical protein